MASLRVWMGVSAIAAAIGIGACSQAADNKAPPIDSVACEDAGPKCGTGANSSTNPPKADAAASDADADAATVQTTPMHAQIGVLDSTFSDQFAVRFNGPGFIAVPTPSGQRDVPIEVDAGLSGTDVGEVAVGWGWFQVRPTANADLLTTHSLLQIKGGLNADPLVPVIDRISLGTVYTSTSLTSTILPTAAQIIVLFDLPGGAPATGVRVTVSPFLADALLYDTGPGTFQVETLGTRTGSAGIVIFANVTSGLGSISFDFEGKVQVSPSITWVIGQATVAHVVVSPP